MTLGPRNYQLCADGIRAMVSGLRRAKANAMRHCLSDYGTQMVIAQTGREGSV